MQRCALVLVGFGVVVALPAEAQPRPNPAPQAYEGLWGADGIAACRDEDGVNRMEITGKRLFWYETRCRALSIEAQGPRSWTMRLSCEGEGQRFRARPRLSLACAGQAGDGERARRADEAAGLRALPRNRLARPAVKTSCHSGAPRSGEPGTHKHRSCR